MQKQICEWQVGFFLQFEQGINKEKGKRLKKLRIVLNLIG
jgi:hypothetical protein